MAIATTTIIVAAALIAAAGVSAYGQHQAAKSQTAIAQFNADAQEKQGATQLQAMRIQAALTKQQADANLRLRSMEAEAHVNNAVSIENQALGQDAINRDNLIKRRAQFAEMQSSQRASLAASGVSESTGTPLDLLAETAMRIQQDQEEQHYGDELKRRTLFSEAAQERLGGKLALAGATLDRDSQVSAAALREATGRSEYVGALRTAEITRLTGKASAQALNYEAGATLLSGVAGAAGKFKSS